jgi:molybdenum cofactor cytidylyltransferase
MSQSLNIAILILAAGESKRMQGIKQLLPWKNTTLLGNAIEQAIQSKGNAIYVVLGANSNKISPSIAHYNVQIIENKNWKSGIGKSIACGVNFLRENHLIYDAILIMLGDQPLISSLYFNLLIDKYSQKEAKIIASETNNKPSVPAIFDAVYFDSLAQLSEDKGAKEILITAEKEVYILHSNVDLMDVDTLSSYENIYNSFGKV